MRILLINHRYFVSGGPERYLFNVTDLLEHKGHEVVPFSIAYDKNEPTPYEHYFVQPIGTGSDVFFRDHDKRLRTYARTLERSFYSPTVYRKLAELIADAQPDVALVLHYLRKLSPSVLKCLADNEVPFAVRLSDFAMVCPNAHLLRNGAPCELCVTGGMRYSVRHRCVQGSLGASAVNYAAMTLSRRIGLFGLVERFIVPTDFIRSIMLAAGWSAEQLVIVPTPVTMPRSGTSRKTMAPSLVYAGRLDEIKGVDVVIEALGLLRDEPSCAQLSMAIAGEGPFNYVNELRTRVDALGLNNVRFVGELELPQLSALLATAWASVVPSRWYENLPNAALESMATGTAVIASGHGSLSTLVEDGVNGWLARPGDARSWADAIKRAISNPVEAWTLGLAARDHVRERHSPEQHYAGLMKVFDDVRARRESPERRS